MRFRAASRMLGNTRGIFNYDEDMLDFIVEHELIEGPFDCLLEMSAVRFLCFIRLN